MIWFSCTKRYSASKTSSTVKSPLSVTAMPGQINHPNTFSGFNDAGQELSNPPTTTAYSQNHAICKETNLDTICTPSNIYSNADTQTFSALPTMWKWLAPGRSSVIVPAIENELSGYNDYNYKFGILMDYIG